MDDEVSFTLSNLKSGGRIYYDCIRPGYELRNTNNDEPFNYTQCDGTDWTPSLSDFSCIGMCICMVNDKPMIKFVYHYSCNKRSNTLNVME